MTNTLRVLAVGCINCGMENLSGKNLSSLIIL